MTQNLGRLLKVFSMVGLILFFVASTVHVGIRTALASDPAAEARTASSAPSNRGKTNRDDQLMEFSGDVIDGNVTDFKSEVIKGDRNRSPVFIDLVQANPEGRSIIFNRPDFNDFHDIEKSRRLRVQTARALAP